MEDKVLEVEEIPEKGLTVTTVVAEGLIETAVQHIDPLAPGTGATNAPEVAIIQRPLSAGNPLLQHDLIVRDVHAGVYDNFSQQTAPEAASVPEDFETAECTLSANESNDVAG